jgi:hypothetical protein
MKKLSLLFLFLIPALIHAQPDSNTVPPHYLFPVFGKAVVKMKLGGYQYADMNYNTVTEEMIFTQNNTNLAIDKPETIDSIYLNQKVFIPVNRKFYELAFNGNIQLLIQHRKTLIDGGKPAAYGGTTQTSAVTSITSLSSGGNIYKLKLPDSYTAKDATLYWINTKGKFRNFINEKQLGKILPDQKVQIRNFVMEHSSDFKKTEDVIAIVKFLNTNDVK